MPAIEGAVVESPQTMYLQASCFGRECQASMNASVAARPDSLETGGLQKWLINFIFRLINYYARNGVD
jgi:hypothetical protein